MVYLVGIVSIYLCKLLMREREPEIRRRTVIAWGCFVFFLISACRGTGVGIDTPNYMEKFELIREHSFLDILTSFYTERLEIGYALMNKIISLFCGDPYAVIVVNSAIVSAGMAYYLIHYSKEESTALILFVCGGMFLQSLNVARQVIAAVLLLNSWGALNRKEYKKTAILFAVSITFHWTSIIFLTAYVFYFIRTNTRLVLALMILSLVVIANYEPIIEFLSQVLTSHSYLANAYGGQITANGIWAIWIVELLIAGLFLMFYFTKRKCLWGLKLPKSLRRSSCLMCVPLFVIYYILLTFIGTRFNFFNRLGVFFLPFVILLFTNMGKLLKHNSRSLYQIYCIGLHVCFIAFLLWSTRTGQFKYPFP